MWHTAGRIFSLSHLAWAGGKRAFGNSIQSCSYSAALIVTGAMVFGFPTISQARETILAPSTNSEEIAGAMRQAGLLVPDTMDARSVTGFIVNECPAWTLDPSHLKMIRVEGNFTWTNRGTRSSGSTILYQRLPAEGVGAGGLEPNFQASWLVDHSHYYQASMIGRNENSRRIMIFPASSTVFGNHLSSQSEGRFLDGWPDAFHGTSWQRALKESRVHTDSVQAVSVDVPAKDGRVLTLNARRFEVSFDGGNGWVLFGVDNARGLVLGYQIARNPHSAIKGQRLGPLQESTTRPTASSTEEMSDVRVAVNELAEKGLGPKMVVIGGTLKIDTTMASGVHELSRVTVTRTVSYDPAKVPEPKLDVPDGTPVIHTREEFVPIQEEWRAGGVVPLDRTPTYNRLDIALRAEVPRSASADSLAAVSVVALQSAANGNVFTKIPVWGYGMVAALTVVGGCMFERSRRNASRMRTR